MVVRRDRAVSSFSLLLLIPAALLSALFHVLLIAMMFLLNPPAKANTATERAMNDKEVPIKADAPEPEQKSDPFLSPDIDPAAQDVDVETNFKMERLADVSVPGLVNPTEKVGNGGPADLPPINLPAPGGFGKGQGGALEGDFTGSSMATGMPGGYTLQGLPPPGSFAGRSGGTREIALRDGGGTKASEAAVTRGLIWLAKNQHPEGKWQLEGAFTDKGASNDTAGTAFGLLPMLGAGKTHKPAPDNPWDKPIEKALAFLIRRQNKKNGDLGGGMYSHGLATIALCEAYALTKDPQLKRPAQAAINYIVDSQHAAGGWRYGPGQAGDTSAVGWQVMALKSAQMAGLDVPEATMRKAIAFLDSVCDRNNEGYGYVSPGSTAPMSAVGLLCRQYLQGWGPQNIRMIKGIDSNIKPTPPGAAANMYYYYYATQVMHHFGGEGWKNWNEKMREGLIAKQVAAGPDMGSWSSAGDAHGGAGGRVMQTSLSLLTLEVYYRHLPLFQRQSAAAQETK